MDPPPYPSHHDYKSVPESEAEIDIALPELEQKEFEKDEPPPRRKRGFLRRHVLTILLILLSLTTALLILSITAAITIQPLREYLHTLSKTTRPVRSCGQTATEARARGCEFDPLAACWLHKDCALDYTEEFLSFVDGKPFEYYYDQAGTRKMEHVDEIAELGYYWSSIREHLVHCSFILRRGHDTRDRGARVDSMAGDLHHSDHCSEFLMDNLGKTEAELDRIGTYGEVGFLTC